MNIKIVRTPGYLSNRREREKEKERRYIMNIKRVRIKQQVRCMKIIRDTVDGATLRPNRRAGRNSRAGQGRVREKFYKAG